MLNLSILASKEKWQYFDIFVLILLLPLYLCAIGLYGWKIVVVLILCIGIGWTVDGIAAVLRNDSDERKNTLLWFMFPLAVPAGAPLWMAPVGLCFALTIGVHFFGGPNKNLFNGVALGIVFLQLSYPMIWQVSLSKPFYPTIYGFGQYSSQMMVVESPLKSLKSNHLISISDLVWGQVPGSPLDSLSVMLILIGVFLLKLGFLDYRWVTGSIIGLGVWATVGNSFFAQQVLHFSTQLFVGSFLPFIMLYSLDYSALPRTPKGRWIGGFMVSFFTVFIRGFADFSEGVSFAVLLVNMFTPLIDQIVVDWQIKPQVFKRT